MRNMERMHVDETILVVVQRRHRQLEKLSDSVTNLRKRRRAEGSSSIIVQAGSAVFDIEPEEAVCQALGIR